MTDRSGFQLCAIERRTVDDIDPAYAEHYPRHAPLIARTCEALTPEPRDHPGRCLERQRVTITPAMRAQMQAWKADLGWSFRTIASLSGVRANLCSQLASGYLRTVGRNEWAAITVLCDSASYDRAVA